MKYQIHSMTFLYDHTDPFTLSFDRVPFYVEDIDSVKNRLMSVVIAKRIDFTYEEIPVDN